ncbi:MAG: hypothetical protein JEY91_08060 [Spirochaetaceae bacterium]|nr:hypothetical protein [Spirochaetaceae bacterium]
MLKMNNTTVLEEKVKDYRIAFKIQQEKIYELKMVIEKLQKEKEELIKINKS